MFDESTHNRLTMIAQALTEDGFAPHGVAIILPTSDEDAALVQEYGNNIAKLRALIAGENDLRDAERQLEMQDETIRELQDAVAGAVGVADRRERTIEGLRADLAACDRDSENDHATNVRLSDELAAMRARAEDAESNYEDACQSVGILAGELHRMGGIAANAERKAERARKAAL